MGLVEDTERRRAKSGERVDVFYEGDGYVVGDELVAHSEEGVGVYHLFAWVGVYLYVSNGFCFE